MKTMSKNHLEQLSRPNLESLEQRLYLTTLMGGEYFVYQNSQGLACRVDLIGAPTDSAEIMTLLPSDTGPGTLINTPGLVYNGTDVTQVLWPTGSPLVYIDPANPGIPRWYSWDDFKANPNNDPNTPAQYRTAKTEIYAIYVASATADTRLVLSVITSNGFNAPNEDWSGTNLWSATNLPLQGGPAGSGGVLLGGNYDPLDPADPANPTEAEMIRYDGQGDTELKDMNGLGVYPGGIIHPGVMISDGDFPIVPGGQIGQNVNSVGQASDGTLYVLDSGLFRGQIISDGSLRGLGSSAPSIEVTNNGKIYTVNNNPLPSFDLMNLGTDSGALAVKNGTVYSIDSTNWTFKVNGIAVGTDIRDATGHVFSKIYAMDHNPVDGVLYAIAQDCAPPPDSGTKSTRFLIAIDPTNGQVINSYPLGSISNNVYTPSKGDFQAMAFSANGTLYAYEAIGAKLDTIALTIPGDLGREPFAQYGEITTVGNVVPKLTGLDFIGSTLYGVADRVLDGNGNQTAPAKLFTINAATGVDTLVTTLTMRGVGSLSYDAVGYPGYLLMGVDGAGNDILAKVPLAAMLRGVDPTTGTATDVAPLTNAVTPSIGYKNITALDFHNGITYATATVFSLDPVGNNLPQVSVLITINAATGAATQVAALDATYNSIAFNANGVLYGATSANRLVTVNMATGVSTSVGNLATAITGLSFITVDGTQVLYGVSNNSVYAINTATGAEVLMGATGLTGLASLGQNDSLIGPLTVFATYNDAGAYRLARIDLAATLSKVDPATGPTFLGYLLDSANPSVSYKSTASLAFSAVDMGYSAGQPVKLNPFNAVVINPASWSLLTVDVKTIAAKNVHTAAVAALTNNLSTLCFNGQTIYAVDATTNQLITFDSLNLAGGKTVVATLKKLSGATLTGVTGIDFSKSGTLQAITGSEFYSIALPSGVGTLSKTFSISGFTGLSADVADPSGKNFWATVQISGGSYLVYLSLSTVTPSQDFDRIMVEGTISGAVMTAGNLNVLYAGFIFGNVTVGQNLTDVVVKTSGSGDIKVGGTIAMVQATSGSSGFNVKAGITPSVAKPGNTITELGDDGGWVGGGLSDYVHKTAASAQIVNVRKGDMVLKGNALSGLDYFALSLMAGQSILIDAAGDDINSRLEVMDTNSFYAVNDRLQLQDNTGRVLDTVGIETVEDYGWLSGGRTQKVSQFTAPAAGVYYIMVSVDPNSSGNYTLFVEGISNCALGGVSAVAGSVGGTIETVNAADLGMVTAPAGGISADIWAHVGGDLIAVMGATVGGATVTSDSNIGFVGATAGSLKATIKAGTMLYNTSANIQNVYTSGDLYADMTATGNIGVVEVGGGMGDSHIGANADGIGGGGRVDLIHVVGDWGGPKLGSVSLSHGPGGDFGAIIVGGEIWDSGNILHKVSENIHQGDTFKINDDGGGHMTVTGQTVPVLDDQGHPVLDNNGKPEFFSTTVKYYLIPVDDGVGGVATKMTIDGPVSIVNDGVTDIGQLVLTHSGADQRPVATKAADTVTITGAGVSNVYFLDAAQDFGGFNNTLGGLVSGKIAGMNALTLKDSLGPTTGSTGAWLFGHELAPTSASAKTEPQYGWFHGTINGINASGPIGTITVGGALGDVRSSSSISKITVNSDNKTTETPNGWDGVMGIVWTQDYLDVINVGDGLADDGAASVYRAGIYSTGWIGTVTIDGRLHTVGSQVFGEINGSILATGANVPYDFTDANGNVIRTVTDTIGQVLGTNGSVFTATVAATDLDVCLPVIHNIQTYGAVGKVSFTGVGAQITGASIFGNTVGDVFTSADSQGITQTEIWASLPSAGRTWTVGKVTGGGPGVNHVTINAHTGGLAGVFGSGPVADLQNLSIKVNEDIGSLRGRDIFMTTVSAPGTIGDITTTRDFIGNEGGLNTTLIGGVGKLSVAGQFLNNYLAVAGTIGSAFVGGSVSHSDIILQGPDTAYLKSLTVNGDFDGNLLSAGHIGNIVIHGEVSGNISTITSGHAGDIVLLQADHGISGNLSVAGSLGTLQSSVSLGVVPGNGKISQVFNIWGDLGAVKVLAAKGSQNHLYATLNVGGNVKSVSVAGTLFGGLNVNGNIDSLQLAGGLGGMIGGFAYGNVSVLGSIKTLKFNSASDLVADMSVGGSLSGLTLNGGDILGDITLPSGSIAAITVNNGSILGDIHAASIGKVSVTGGNVAGDLSSTLGSITSISVKGGSILGNIDVDNGSIGTMTVSGDVSGNVTVGGNITKANLGGNMSGVFQAGGRIDLLSMKTNMSGRVSADFGLKALQVGGVMSGVARSGTTITSVTAGSMAGATVSSGSDIGTVRTTAGMANSFVLAGTDVGRDGVRGNADDNPIFGAMHSGNIAAMQVGGVFDTSVVSAGIGVGADLSYTQTADNTKAAGTSSISKMTVGGFANAAASAVLADSYLDANFRANAQASLHMQAAAAVVPGVGTEFGVGSAAGTTISANGMTMTLTGPGRAFFDAVNNLIDLHGTTSASSLIVTGASITPLDITTTNDSALGTLSLAAAVTAGDINVDGLVGNVTLGAIQNGSTLLFPGGITRGSMNPQGANLAVRTGPIGQLQLLSNLGGTFVTDRVGTLTVNGALASDFKSAFGGMNSFTAASLGGDMVVAGNVNTMTVTGNMSGNIDVQAGDVKTFKSGIFSGTMNVQRGLIGSVTINGDFVGDDTTALRSANGMGSVTVNGDFAGVMGSRGQVGAVKTTGTFSGRLGASLSIKSFTAAAMEQGMVFAGNDIPTVKITGNMLDSMILAGFDAGDAALADLPDNAIQLDARSVAPVAANLDATGTGNIKTVTIGGQMERSSIGAGVSPGADGYLGSFDDRVYGSGTIGKVTVTTGVLGSDDGDSSYGIVAATNVPTVTSYKQGFVGGGNVIVKMCDGMAGALQVVGADMRYDSLVITFNHPMDFSTFNTGSVKLQASHTPDYAVLTDVLGTTPYTIQYDPATYAVTISIDGSWEGLNLGSYFRLTITADKVSDNRGNHLDGEFTGLFPTGDNNVGGDFVYEFSVGDVGDTFDKATDLTLVEDHGMKVIAGAFEQTGDVDIYHFTASQYKYVSVQLFTTGIYGRMALMRLDNQGTASPDDDTYEAIGRVEFADHAGQDLFAGYEIPSTGDYYLVVTWSGYVNSAPYTLSLTYNSTDTKMVQTLNKLPDGGRISYISNTLNAHNNELGYNTPKQLVYVNFNGGTAIRYKSEFGFTVDVAKFNLDTQVDHAIKGMESILEHGNAAVTGIMANLMTIFKTTPASNPLGKLNVQEITNGLGWANYAAAADGLWFTTIDPATQGYDPARDFTTIFVGKADDWQFSGANDPYGIASEIDVANMDKADNAVVFSQRFAGLSRAATVNTKLNQYSISFANVIAHELGHTLGLDYHPTAAADPTDTSYYMLTADDPDNNAGTPDDSNIGASLMAYPPASAISTGLLQLGTANADRIFGQLDHVEQLLWYLK